MGVNEPIETKVLDTLVVKDLGSCLEPGNVSSVGRPLWDEASDSSQHSPTCVDQFELSVLGESLWISRESGSIPAIVSWELTSEVWDLWGEWTKVLWTVWSIPANKISIKSAYFHQIISNHHESVSIGYSKTWD